MSSWVVRVGEVSMVGVRGVLRFIFFFCFVGARICWSWWSRFELGIGIRCFCSCLVCYFVLGFGGRVKRVCGVRAELGGS